MAFIDSVKSFRYEDISSDPKTAIEKLIPLLEKAENFKYELGEAAIYDKLALAYSYRGDQDKATEAFLKAIPIYEKFNSEEELIDLYGEYGYSRKDRDIKTSKKYMRLAIQLAEKNKKRSALSKLYDNYGIISEISNNLDSALYFYNKGLSLKYELKDTLGIPFSLNHLAGIYALTGYSKKAFEIMRESDAYRSKEKGRYGRAENAVIYGDLYFSIVKFDSAEYYYKKALRISKSIGNKHMSSYCFEQLSKLYEKQEKYKLAYINYKSYKTYADSMVNLETNKTIAKLELNYETSKKDNKIYKSELALKEKTNLLTLSWGIAIILLLVSLSTYKYQTLKRKRIRGELELKNKLKKAEYEQKINMEKSRISRELHDNIGSQLTFIISSLDNISYIEKNSVKAEKTKRLSVFGRNTLSELRNTIWALKSEENNVDSLVLKMNELKLHFLEHIPDLSISIKNNATENIKLSSLQSLNILRIIQEALQNTIKYAKATKFNVSFENEDNLLILTISDNGIGFDIAKIKHGNGWENIKYRTENSNGTVLITSSTEGTKLICKINLK